MDASSTELLGLVAGVLTTGSFIPQVIKILKTRDVSSISLVMYLAFTFGVLLWCIYGVINGQAAIVASNGITLALASVILGMKIRYR
jgi:MtN3 and saliva related transmembrane protein